MPVKHDWGHEGGPEAASALKRCFLGMNPTGKARAAATAVDFVPVVHVGSAGMAGSAAGFNTVESMPDRQVTAAPDVPRRGAS